MADGKGGLDKAALEAAFGAMGAYLRERNAMAEICLYGGSAIMFLYDWRRSTHDVDVVIRDGDDHALLLAARLHAAKRLGLPENWLNDAVTQFASPLAGGPDRREVGLYPNPAYPALRVMSASPEYLLAMKVVALDSRRATRDLTDSVRLAREVGATTEDDVLAVVHRFFPDYRSGEGDVPAEVAMAASAQVPE